MSQLHHLITQWQMTKVELMEETAQMKTDEILPKWNENDTIRLFKKAMPTFNRLKLLEEPENAMIQELCTKARQKLIFRELCPVDDWSRDGFNEMSTHKSEKFLTVLTKMTETQNSLENRINALTENISQPPQETAKISTHNKNGEATREDDIIKIVETDDIIVIKDRLLPEPQSKSRKIWNNFRGTF